jgi:hypothetical protein
MRLFRLLAAGKTLVGLEGSGSRYQVTRQRMLPSFGSKKNPFRATVRPEPPAPAAGLSGPATEDGRDLKLEVQGAKRAGFVTAVFLGGETRVPECEPVGQGGKNPKALEVPRGGVQKGVSETGNFRSKLSGLFPWRRPEKAKLAMPPSAEAMVQAELSLKSVKVVRNDLSDTDLEIVQGKSSRAPASGARVAQRVTNRSGAESAWDRVAGRLFGAGKM